MTTELHDVFPDRSPVRKAQQIARRAVSLSSAIAVASTLLVGVSTATVLSSASAEETTPTSGDVAAAVVVSPSPAPETQPTAEATPTAVSPVLSGRAAALQRASRAGLAAGSFRSKAYGIAYAREWARFAYKWDEAQTTCLNKLWQSESSWRWNAKNRRTGAYGIAQALPGKKMASEGKDWKTNPETQIRWGLKYIKSRHATPCKALAFKARTGWY